MQTFQSDISKRIILFPFPSSVSTYQTLWLVPALVFISSEAMVLSSLRLTSSGHSLCFCPFSLPSQTSHHLCSIAFPPFKLSKQPSPRSHHTRPLLKQPIELTADGGRDINLRKSQEGWLRDRTKNKVFSNLCQQHLVATRTGSGILKGTCHGKRTVMSH